MQRRARSHREAIRFIRQARRGRADVTRGRWPRPLLAPCGRADPGADRGLARPKVAPRPWRACPPGTPTFRRRFLREHRRPRAGQLAAADRLTPLEERQLTPRSLGGTQGGFDLVADDHLGAGVGRGGGGEVLAELLGSAPVERAAGFAAARRGTVVVSDRLEADRHPPRRRRSTRAAARLSRRVARVDEALLAKELGRGRVGDRGPVRRRRPRAFERHGVEDAARAA